MALSIGVTCGSRIKIGSSMLVVSDIRPGIVTVEIDNGKPVLITDKERREVLPKVFLSLGLINASSGTSSSRLAFEAPKEIKINRLKD